MDRIDCMRAFVAVAATGSFAEAARQLRQSPSGTSRAVAELEAQLGLVLFNRTTRSVKLTERGRIYLESCRQILDDIETAEAYARGEGARPQGVLTVAAPILFGRLHILPLVNALLAAQPTLAVRLILSDRNAHLAEEGIDVAVRIGDLGDSSLMARKLGRVCTAIVASPDYLAEHGVPETPDDLKNHAIIAFEPLDTTNEWRIAPGVRPVRLMPRLMVNSADAAITAAEAGVGVTRALSYQVRAGVEAGHLVPILTRYKAPEIPVSALYPPRRIISPNLEAFLQFAGEYFRSNPVVPLWEWGNPG
ncbi:LysR family transcriptional regulator [Kordiimonas sp.]|uniref:LysR family transcriptional regulator n=1 Tax=Kordiimonas sp. TaxID=1970157 RepID=UPI003A95B629